MKDSQHCNDHPWVARESGSVGCWHRGSCLSCPCGWPGIAPEFLDFPQDLLLSSRNSALEHVGSNALTAGENGNICPGYLQTTNRKALTPNSVIRYN